MAPWLKPAFNPKMLAPSLWLDASDRHTLFTDSGFTTLCADGQRLGSIRDKSGNGWSFNIDPTFGPFVTPNIQNGRTVINCTEGYGPTSAFLATYIDYTVFLVAKASSFPAPGNGAMILLNGDGSNGFGATYYTNPTTPNFTMLHGGVAWNQLGAAVLTPEVICVRKDAANNLTLRRNGVETTVAVSPLTGAANYSRIMDGFLGYFMEALIFPLLSVADYLKVETYLRTKWNI
jgi:hypothetical protein